MTTLSTFQSVLEQPVGGRALPKQEVVPTLSIVIVNYRQWRNTARLVRQLLRSPAIPAGLAEIVVVDNNSPFHPMRKWLRRTTGVSLRCLRQNRGFARGANEGCRLSLGSWYLLLNPDVTVPDGFLEKALECIGRAERDTNKTGIVGLQLRDPGGSPQASVGAIPTLLGTVLGLLRPRAQRKCRLRPARSRQKVEWVTGCGMLVRRECFRQLRGFDPAYFLYYEDVDLCRRARLNRWLIRYDPRLHIVHHHPLHSRATPVRTRLFARHALLAFARKHWPWWQTRMLALLVLIESFWRRRRTHRRQASIAIDFIVGRERATYRRILQAAQVGNRSREGVRIESSKLKWRARHERRPLPR